MLLANFSNSFHFIELCNVCLTMQIYHKNVSYANFYLLKFGLAVAVGEGIRKKDNPDELSLFVEQVMELSNHVIDGYVKIVDFAKYFLCGLR